jgi:hypothetical protein
LIVDLCIFCNSSFNLLPLIRRKIALSKNTTSSLLSKRFKRELSKVDWKIKCNMTKENP